MSKNRKDETLLPAVVDDGPLEVPTDIPDPVITDEDAFRIFKRMGMAAISPSVIRDLGTLGIYVKGVGVLRNQRGTAILSQQRLNLLLETIMKNVIAADKKGGKDKVKTLSELTKAFGYLLGKMTESQRFVVEMEGGFTAPVRKAEAAAPLVASFVPGQDVTPGTMVINKEVNIYTNGKGPDPTG